MWAVVGEFITGIFKSIFFWVALVWWGKSREKTRQKDKVIEDAIKAREIEDEVDRMSNNTISDRMRKFWTRQ